MAKGNHKGVKWNKGGKLKRIRLELGGFDELITKLDEMGANVEDVVTEALESAGEDVGVRTKEAMANEYLPAHGEYSKEETIESVVVNPKCEWHGLIVEIGLGFDKVKNGVGSLLITGTPRMEPDRELEKIFVRKSYAKEINGQIQDDLNSYINDMEVDDLHSFINSKKG